MAGSGRQPRPGRRRRALGGAGRASSAAGSTSTSPPRLTSRTTGGESSPSGRAGSASGAASRRARPRASGGSVGPAPAPGLFANAMAPALLVAQAVGRIGNYFNQELFGKPSTLPWALEISPAHRPAGYLAFATFQPTFLYEMIWDLALAAALVWLGHHRRIRPWGLFALYIAGYSAFRIFEESDPDRLLPAFPRPAAELLCRGDHDAYRTCLVLPLPARDASGRSRASGRRRAGRRCRNREPVPA